MCDSCVVVESILDTGGVAHIGYGESGKDVYRKLLEDDVVVKIESEVERMEQADFLTLWRKFIRKTETRAIDALRPSGGTLGCALCNTSLVTAPGVEANCDGCGKSKHAEIRRVSTYRDDIQRDMDAFVERTQGAPRKRESPVRLALRTGLHCPKGHWICSECWSSTPV